MKYGSVLASGAFALTCVLAQSGYPTGTGLPRGTPAQETTSNRAQSRRDNALAVPAGQAVFRGILIDAGCRNPEIANLRRPPETLPNESPAQPPDAAQNNPPPAGAVAVKGISVDSATIDAERTGVMDPRVQGMFQRQTDPTCAVTGSTTNFAVLTDNNRLLDLDPGGDTLALVALQSTSGGRSLLNGDGPGVKPRVVVTGQLRGDRLIARDVTAAQ